MKFKQVILSFSATSLSLASTVVAVSCNYKTTTLAQQHKILQIKNLGFILLNSFVKPTLPKNPTQVMINHYNKVVQQFNQNQVKMSLSAKKKVESDIHNLGFPSSKEDIESVLSKNPTKVEINQYKQRVQQFNQEQLKLSLSAKKNVESDIHDLGYVPFKSDAKPKAILSKNPTKNEIDQYKQKVEKFNQAQLSIATIAKKLAQYPIPFLDLGYKLSRDYMKRWDSLLLNLPVPTRQLLAQYNLDVNEFEQKEINKAIEAKNTLAKMHDLGFQSTYKKQLNSLRDFFSKWSHPRKSAIDSYNQKVKQFNQEQLTISTNVKKYLENLLQDLNFTPSKGVIKPTSLAKYPNKLAITQYYQQLQKFNRDQSAQFLRTKGQGYVIEKMVNYEFMPLEKPLPQLLSKFATRRDITKYNIAMKKFNKSQLLKAISAKKSAEDQLRDLGFTPAKTAPKPTPLAKYPMRNAVNRYNEQVKQFNQDQLTKSINAKKMIMHNLLLDLGFTPSKGIIKPTPLAKYPTQVALEQYTQQIQQYNEDQLSNSANAKKTAEDQLDDLNFTPSKGVIKPTALAKQPNKLAITQYYQQLEKFNRDQSAQFLKAKNAGYAIEKMTDYGFKSSIRVVKPNILSKIAKKQDIKKYNRSMKRFNRLQLFKAFKAKKTAEDQLQDLGFTPAKTAPKPTPLAKYPMRSTVDRYNEQVKQFNQDQLKQATLAKDILEHSLLDLGFTPSKGIIKPTPLSTKPTQKEIIKYNEQLIKFNRDQTTKSLNAQRLERLVIKKRDYGFKPSNGVAQPTLLANATPAEIVKYNLQMQRYNRDQAKKYVNATNAGYIIQVKEDQGFKPPNGFRKLILLPETLTQGAVDQYNKQIIKFNQEQMRLLHADFINKIKKNVSPISQNLIDYLTKYFTQVMPEKSQTKIQKAVIDILDGSNGPTYNTILQAVFKKALGSWLKITYSNQNYEKEVQKIHNVSVIIKINDQDETMASINFEF